MTCETCGTQNPEGAQFCGSCGVPLGTRPDSAGSVAYCTSCGAENSAAGGYCAACGAQMGVLGGPALEAETVQTQSPGEYMGFWIRLGAWVIDWIILTVAFIILVMGTDGTGFLLWLLVGILYYVLFTGLQGQTPGKKAFGIKVVNWQGEVPGVGSAALREIIGKFVSGVVIFLGVIWIAFDREKRGWHDKMAGTHVVKK